MAHQMFNLGDFISASIVTCGLLSDQYLVLCLLTKPFKWNVASSKKSFLECRCLVISGSDVYTFQLYPVNHLHRVFEQTALCTVSMTDIQS